MAMGVMSLLCSFLAVLMIAMTIASDQAALIAFKAQVSDGGSLASWNSSTGFCSWEGVICSHRRPARVVALILNGTGLTGALSPAIGNLTFLQILDMRFNWLHGDIPASLGRLRRLQSLYLNDNAFSGTFPVNLSSCISMTIMILDNNKLGGRIPAELGEKLRVTTASRVPSRHHWPICPIYNTLISPRTSSLARSHWARKLPEHAEIHTLRKPSYWYASTFSLQLVITGILFGRV